MKFKNVKEKIKFIDNLECENNQTILNLISILSHLAKDKNTDVKEALAKQLVIFDADAIEYILYDMLSDKNRMVRLEALDSLSIGRHDETIEKVGNMLEGDGYLIRMYAVLTLFDLITNAYGLNAKAYDKSFQAEKNPHVLSAYYQNEYYMHQEEGMALLKNLYVEALEAERYDLIWTILHIFNEIKNKNNHSELQQIIEYKNEKLLPVQKALVDNVLENHVQCKILILDDDNTFLSHVVALKIRSLCDEKDVIITSAGVNAGTVLLDSIRLFCERNYIACPETIYSKRITEAYVYDYIICLNTKLDKNVYSETKAFYYENIDVNKDGQILSICEDIKARLL